MCARMQARKEKEEAWQEQQRAAAEKRLSWKQKEKRKREQGQAKGGKGNYVGRGEASCQRIWSVLWL